LQKFNHPTPGFIIFNITQSKKYKMHERFLKSTQHKTYGVKMKIWKSDLNGQIYIVLEQGRCLSRIYCVTEKEKRCYSFDIANEFFTLVDEV